MSTDLVGIDDFTTIRYGKKQLLTGNKIAI
jgi:hypothetical protein